MLKKVDLIIQVIIENMGGVFVYSDVDVVFFDKISNDLICRLKEKDILFQSDSYNKVILCAGFFVCRANKRVLNLWKTCRVRIKDNLDFDDGLYDQDWINILLKEDPQMVKFGTLPLDKYYSPREMVNLENIPPIPKNVCVYHANFIIGTHKKEQLFSKVQQIMNEGRCVSKKEYCCYCKKYTPSGYLKFKLQLIGKIGSFLKINSPKIYKLLKPYFPDKK